MRDEGDAHRRAGDQARLLLDLGRVPVLVAGLVRHAVLVQLGEQVLRLQLAAGARDARLRVDHDAARLDQPFAQEGGEREDRGGRVAAGDRHQLGLAQRLAVQLGDAVDGARQQIGRRVLAVPLPVDGGVAQPEVRREVEHGDAGLAQRRHRGRGGRVRERGEGELDLARELGGVGRGREAQIQHPAQGREGVAHRLARALLGRHHRELEPGMAQEDPQELEPGVPARSEDRDLHAGTTAWRTGSDGARRAGRTSSAPSCARRGSAGPSS